VRPTETTVDPPGDHDAHLFLEELRDALSDTRFGEAGSWGQVRITTWPGVLAALRYWKDSEKHNGARQMRQVVGRLNTTRSAEWFARAMTKTAEQSALDRGYIEPEPDTYTIGENFGSSWLAETYRKRRNQDRALTVVITARDNATGTGKTTLALALAKKWAGDEWTAEDRATNRAWEYRQMVRSVPEGAVIIADEIGQMFDARRSMSEENVQVSQDWQMFRFRELTTLATLPGTSFLDRRLRQLADVLILATRRGHARVYKLKTDDMSGDPFREHMHNVEWGPMDDDPDYQYVEDLKAERFEERFEESPESIEEEELRAARKEGRDETIRALVEEGFTQSEIAAALDLDQSTVSRILNR
jgi:hypothetical protein